MHLHKDFLKTDKLESKPTRDGFGIGLKELGETNPNVVALCADLTESTRMHWFAEEYPERFVEIGVAEQNLATVAAGLAAVGKIPFAASYATFSPGRNWEQIRTTAAYNNVPVKIVGAHAGISVGPDGATHQALEDIALMRVIPNMTVLVPSDMEEARKATIAAAEHDGPVYLRFGRSGTPQFTTHDTPFKIGDVYELKSGHDATIISTGSMTYNALCAAHELAYKNFDVRVLSVPTIKPMDPELVIKAAKETGRLITVEEHQVSGGLGGAVAEIVTSNHPVQILRLGIHDRFGESGSPDELMKHFKLDKEGIVRQVTSFLAG